MTTTAEATKRAKSPTRTLERTKATSKAAPKTANKAVPKAAKTKLGKLAYRHPNHKELPHIVSFSGGRSSAALTFMAAKEGLLKPERGDAVLFANTSAEHPGTYEFAATCKERLEKEFNLPCFWFEFCTVEDAWHGEYRRRPSYRLVKSVALSDEEPYGYHSNGEVFEEMVAWQGMLPNPHSRTCTAKLKLFPSHELLGEWLGRTTGPSHTGHHWNESNVSKDSLKKATPFAGGGGRLQ